MGNASVVGVARISLPSGPVLRTTAGSGPGDIPGSQQECVTLGPGIVSIGGGGRTGKPSGLTKRLSKVT